MLRTSRTYQRCAVKACPFITPGIICRDHASHDSAEWAADDIGAALGQVDAD